MLLEAGAECVDLLAGGAQAGDFEDGFRADVQECGGGQREEVDVLGEDIFAEIAGAEEIALEGESGELFRREEMDLAKIGEGGISTLQVEMLRGGAAVGVALDALAGDDADGSLWGLGEAVCLLTGDVQNSRHVVC